MTKRKRKTSIGKIDIQKVLKLSNSRNQNRHGKLWRPFKNMKWTFMNLIDLVKWKEYFGRRSFLKSIRRGKETDNLHQPITADEILKVLKCMKNNKAPYPGCLHTELIKHAPMMVIETLESILNACLEGANVPEQWKFAYVSPILKKVSVKQLTESCVANIIRE